MSPRHGVGFHNIFVHSGVEPTAHSHDNGDTGNVAIAPPFNVPQDAANADPPLNVAITAIVVRSVCI